MKAGARERGGFSRPAPPPTPSAAAWKQGRARPARTGHGRSDFASLRTRGRLPVRPLALGHQAAPNPTHPAPSGPFRAICRVGGREAGPRRRPGRDPGPGRAVSTGRAANTYHNSLPAGPAGPDRKSDATAGRPGGGIRRCPGFAIAPLGERAKRIPAPRSQHD